MRDRLHWAQLREMRLAEIVALVVAVAVASKVSAAPTEDGQPSGQDKPTPKPKIYFLHIKSDIRSRYAKTLVTSKVANPADKAQEVVYHITIPESAFISNFSMLVDGELMEGQVRERAEAKHDYQAAQQAGQSAGHVATATVRDSNQVSISVNVAAQSKVTFNLTYEELLVRRKGRYELAINVSPGQVVKDLAIEVFLEEHRNITLLQVPEFRSTNEIDFEERDEISNYTSIEKISKQKLHLTFSPSESDQVKLAGGKESGLGGKFVVRYDVDRKNQPLSEVLTKDGYFVHFFSPPEVKPLPKHVVFVLDVSGSMYGKKMDQLKEAMNAILGELRPEDYFNLIEFSHPVTILDLDTPSNNIVISPAEGQPWYEQSTTVSPEKIIKTVPDLVKAFPATPDYVNKAKEAVEKMSANGGTNIHDSVKAAIEVARKAVPNDNSTAKLPAPIIIFLTDGEATVGEVRSDYILKTLPSEEEKPVPLFSLAFGDDADLKFLKRLSLRAGAFARKIYEAADAALQLRDFYRQVASPLLTNVTFDYDASKVEKTELTKDRFDLMFSGSEFVVAGKLKSGSKEVSGIIMTSKENYPVLPITGDHLGFEKVKKNDEDNFLERLWAFLSIKQQLDKYEAWKVEPNDANKEEVEKSPAKKAREEAVKLALEFSFVTPLTSLVVVKKDKPEEKTKNSTETVPITIGNEDNAMAFSHNGASFSNAFAQASYQGSQGVPSLQSHTYRPQAPPPSTTHRYGAGGQYLSAGGSGGHSYQASSRPGGYPGYSQQSIGLSGPSSIGRPGVAYSPGTPGTPGRPGIPTRVTPGSTQQSQTSPEKKESKPAHESSFEADSDVEITAPTIVTAFPETATLIPTTTISETEIKISDISWLTPAQNQTNSSDSQSFTLSNGTEIYKILAFSKSQNVTGARCEKSSSPSTCKPFTACVLSIFAENSTPDLFVQSYKCDVTVGSESYLGVCCPDNNQGVKTTRLEAEEN